MNREVEKAAALIREKTGKKVVVYTKDMEYCSAGQEGLADAIDGELKRISSYKVKNKTYFPFRYGSVDYVGYIDGVSDSDKAFAALCAAVLGSGAIKEQPASKKDALKSVLLGESDENEVGKFVKKYSVPDYACAVYVVYSADGRAAEVVNFLENFKNSPCDLSVMTDDFTCAHVRFREGGEREADSQTLTDYAFLLVRSVEEELGIKISVGVGNEVKGFSEAATSYSQAATALRMNNVFEGKTSVSTYKEFILVKMLEELPRYKLREYFDFLTDDSAKELLEDPDMVETAEEFLQSDLNVSETSRKLYMHRNPLTYRLDKIEQATGLDVRKFQDATTFRLILILYRLLS